jgi:hypothetical protein
VVEYIRITLNYPGLKQAAVLEKTDAQGRRQRWYLLTSLDRKALPPKRFLKAIRNHWEIENGLHHVKDRTLKEDIHRTKFPALGTTLAILRNGVVSILNRITPPKRRKCSRPIQLLALQAHPLSTLQRLAMI